MTSFNAIVTAQKDASRDVAPLAKTYYPSGSFGHFFSGIADVFFRSFIVPLFSKTICKFKWIKPCAVKSPRIKIKIYCDQGYGREFKRRFQSFCLTCQALFHQSQNSVF